MSSFDKILKQVKQIYPRAKIEEFTTAMDDTITSIKINEDFYIARQPEGLYLSLRGYCIYTNIDHMMRILAAIKNKKGNENYEQKG